MKKRLLTIVSIMMMAVLMLGSMGTSVFAQDKPVMHDETVSIYDEETRTTSNFRFVYRYFDLKGNADSRTFIYLGPHLANKDAVPMDVVSMELIDPETFEKLDSSVATVSYENLSNGVLYKFTFNKEGKIIVKTGWSDGDTITYFYSGDDVVDTPYTCPIKTLKLGKINMTKKLGHSKYIVGKPFKGKVTFKAKKGWKLTGIYKYKGGWEEKGSSPVYYAQKKNQTVTLKKGWEYKLVFKKGNETTFIVYKAR